MPKQAIDKTHSPFIQIGIIAVFAFAFGFPGQYVYLLGGAFMNALSYGLFALEIGLMLLMSGNSLMEVKIINLKWEYLAIYAFTAIIFITSMYATAFPKEQAISCVRFMVTALFCLWLVDHYSVDETLMLMYRAQWFIVIATIMLMVGYYNLAYTMADGAMSLNGLYNSKNPCGNELATGMILQLCTFLIRRKKNEQIPAGMAILFFTEMFLLAETRATGAIMCMLIVAAYLMGYAIVQLRLRIGELYTVISIGFLVFAQKILPYFEPFFLSIGKDITLSGRTPMWEQLTRVMKTHNTLTGFGFSMFWRDPDAVRLFQEGFNSDQWASSAVFGAHNTIIELWLDIGLVGLILYFIMIILAFRSVKTMTEESYIVSSAIILILLIRGLTERSYTTFGYQSMLLFLACGLALSRKNRVVIEDT